MKMINLKELYLEDLGKLVNYSGKNPRPRVRNIQQWKKVESIINESKRQPFPINEHTASKVWCISDTHFGHKNIIEFSDRPFMNVQEMDDIIIENFNDYVSPDDISIWVGDVSFYGPQLARKLINRCNGYKILVAGNHDFKKKKIPDIGFDETHLLYNIELPEANLVFTHYPMENLPKPLINIHGHLHLNSSLDSDQHINVCCEYHGFKPIDLYEIYKWSASRVKSFDL